MGENEPNPDYIAALDRAWRAVDAEGGTGMSRATEAALDAVIAAIEALGGMDPGHRAALSKALPADTKDA